MIRPTLFEGSAVALAASVAGSALHAALAPLTTPATALRLPLILLGLGYALYLLHRCPGCRGRAAALGAWLLLTLAGWWLSASASGLLAVQLALIWLIRASYFQRGVLAALADLALIGLGLCAARGAWLHTGSSALALWCFFVIQALFSAIPRQQRARRRAAPEAPSQRFEQAYQSALQALRRL